MAAEQSGTQPFGIGNLPKAQDESHETRRHRGERGLLVAARVLAGAMTFFFLAFAFAYVYLKTANIENKWRPPHVEPVQSWGVVFVVCLVISAAAMLFASRTHKAGKDNWLNPAIGALIFGVLAIVAQVIEYTQQDFGPSNFAYASTFIAWTGFYLLVTIAALYWIEIVVATEIRERNTIARAPGEGTLTPENPDMLLPRGVAATAFFWVFHAAIGVVMWVLVYLVK